MKTQLTTTPSPDKEGSIIRQDFGNEFLYQKDESDINCCEIISHYSYHNKDYRPKDFTRFQAKKFSNWWITLAVSEVKGGERKGKKIQRLIERSIQIDKEQALQLIENLKILVNDMTFDRELKK